MEEIKVPANDILVKIKLLKSRDHNFEGMHLFGSHAHHYELGNPLTDSTIAELEKKHQITIPDDYRSFLKHVGCGASETNLNLAFGAGPYEGIIGLYDSFELEHGALNENFPFSSVQPWDTLPEEYKSGAKIPGAFIISLYEGSRDERVLLVLTGEEKGHLWVDARNNGNGVYPLAKDDDGDYTANTTERTTFIKWYMNWLNHYVKESERFVR